MSGGGVMPSPLFVSFFSGPGYAEEAKGLIETLEKFNCRYHIVALDDSGSWVKNCARKPSFILDCRRQYPGTPLVWLDADARVMSKPDLFEQLDHDVGFHLRDDVELLSGTMFWNATPAAAQLLAKWADWCERYPGEWDQRVLQKLLNGGPWAGKIAHLPASYCSIFDQAMSPHPVIEHRQASRRLKR